MENLGITVTKEPRIAILGANSVLARDFLANSTIPKSVFVCFTRNGRTLDDPQLEVYAYEQFSSLDPYFAIINFVGFGSPVRAVQEASNILEVTRKFDFLALDYVARHPDTAYIFISSGAAQAFADKWGRLGEFSSIKSYLKDDELYAAAKYEAETRHRAICDYNICDIRVFNYVSARQSLNDNFLFTDIARAYLSGGELETSPVDIIRDYSNYKNLVQMIEIFLKKPKNAGVDLYTKKPVSKFDLLRNLSQSVGLKYKLSADVKIMSPTGLKLEYSPRNFGANEMGYSPSTDSTENVLLALEEFTAGPRSLQ